MPFNTVPRCPDCVYQNLMDPIHWTKIFHRTVDGMRSFSELDLIQFIIPNNDFLNKKQLIKKVLPIYIPEIQWLFEILTRKIFGLHRTINWQTFRPSMPLKLIIESRLTWSSQERSQKCLWNFCHISDPSKNLLS